MSKHGQNFIEGNLKFTFDSGWRVIKYDDEPCYRNGIGKLENTKAVDFVATRNSIFHFIEVKDFRGHRIENKQRIADGELAVEVAHKVRDSVAGLYGARRREAVPDSTISRAFGDALNPKRTMRVILWLEEDRPKRRDIRRQGRQSTLLKSLKQHLNWLETRVFVESIANNQLQGVTVVSLPGAGRT